MSTDTTEALLESARRALIDQARATHRHATERDLREGAKQVAYGQALGAQEALAAFLNVVLPDDEDLDPTDMARAYAEGREPERTRT